VTCLRKFLSMLTIFPITFTSEYGFISPLLPMGVGPKNRQIAFPGGQYAMLMGSTNDFEFSGPTFIGVSSV